MTTDNELLRNIRSRFPRIGYRQMRSMLDSDFGIRIQRQRVRMATRLVDPAGAANNEQVFQTVYFFFRHC